MKKLILLLLLTITFISCDTHSDPTIYNTKNKEFEVLYNSDDINMTSQLYKKYEQIPKLGKKSYGYIDNGYYYFITKDNHYYKAKLISNTDYIITNQGFFAIFVIFILFMGIGIRFFIVE